MVTSTDILEATGLKSTRTLTRWHKSGIIPEPLIRTHPSGRGKIAYWPDSVLDRCVRIIELQRQGHSLRSAVMQLAVERVEKLVEEVKGTPSISEVLETKTVTTASGHEVNLLDLFHALIWAEVKEVATTSELRQRILTELRQQKAVDLALNLLRSGYNPVLVYDGEKVMITADFMVAHQLSYNASKGGSLLVVPLAAPLQKAFKGIGSRIEFKPSAHAAPLIRAEEGDAIVEYDVYLLSADRFELIHESARTIGKVQKTASVADRATQSRDPERKRVRRGRKRGADGAEG